MRNMDVKSTLEEAQDIVLNQRDQQYGSNSRLSMHIRIAKVWSGILDREVQPAQVALMMAGLKLVRADNAPNHGDSYVDAAGYVAIAAEIIGVRNDKDGVIDPELAALAGGPNSVFDQTVKERP